MKWKIAFVAASLCTANAATAEVVDLSPSGFVIKHQVRVTASPSDAYAALVGKIGQWWNPEHTYSNDAGNLSIDARPGGCFCEKLPHHGGVQHMAVVFVAPGKTLRMTGGLGPLQGSGVAGSMTWSFTADGAQTRIALTYSVGGYWQGGFGQIAPAVDAVIGEQVNRLKSFIETGKPGAER